MAGVGLTAYTERDSAGSDIEKIHTTVDQKTGDMKNLISIVEIPTADFSRAMNFYRKVLEIQIEEVEMDGIKLGLFANSGDGPVVQLIHGEGYKTSADGTVVYLHGGNDLQKVADKIAANGGKIIIPKTAIGPDMGFYAVFTDTEGNKLGLHSLR
jgi:predicted enzyme related to lactoylglutathione lyase